MNSHKRSDQAEEEGEEDDYMTMVIKDVAPSEPETSLQRRQRLQRNGLQRGRVKSKAELEAEAEAQRAKNLSRPLYADPQRSSKGLAIMAKMGFRAGSALGKATDARTEPIPVVVKDDRTGIGMESDKYRRIREATEAEAREAKRARVDEQEYRERVRRECEGARLLRLVYAAQKVAERMTEERATDDAVALGIAKTKAGEETEEGGGGGDNARPVRQGSSEITSSRPLKSINLLWRGLVKSRLEAERDRKTRAELHLSLSATASRLPSYEEDDDEEDEDDKLALGKSVTSDAIADELDDEDPELDEFNTLEPRERLARVVDYLRSTLKYCFWCKFTYLDEKMDGCPGTTEEEHD